MRLWGFTSPLLEKGGGERVINKGPHSGSKKNTATEMWLYFFVTRLGLEPKTPTLKVLCSTY